MERERISPGERISLVPFGEREDLARRERGFRSFRLEREDLARRERISLVPFGQTQGRAAAEVRRQLSDHGDSNPARHDQQPCDESAEWHSGQYAAVLRACPYSPSDGERITFGEMERELRLERWRENYVWRDGERITFGAL